MGQEILESSIEHAPPPAYSEVYGQVDFQQDGFNTQAHVASEFSEGDLELRC